MCVDGTEVACVIFYVCVGDKGKAKSNFSDAAFSMAVAPGLWDLSQPCTLRLHLDPAVGSGSFLA